jgi:ATP-dependent Zn protease
MTIKCEICGKWFRTARSLLEHCKKKHTNQFEPNLKSKKRREQGEMVHLNSQQFSDILDESKTKKTEITQDVQEIAQKIGREVENIVAEALSDWQRNLHYSQKLDIDENKVKTEQTQSNSLFWDVLLFLAFILFLISIFLLLLQFEIISI